MTLAVAASPSSPSPQKTFPATTMFEDALTYATRAPEKERMVILFEDSETRVQAARAARWFKQIGYRLVELEALEDEAFFWLSAPKRQQKGVEICCGRDIPTAPWLADKITRLFMAVAKEGYLPIFPATCIALNPVLSRLERAGYAFAGIATLEEIERCASSLNRIFPVVVVVKDNKQRDALLRRFCASAIVLPAAPEPGFASRFIHHMLNHSNPSSAALTLFSPRKKGELVDFYSGLAQYYKSFFDPDFVQAELRSCLARTEIAVLRRLRQIARNTGHGSNDNAIGHLRPKEYTAENRRERIFA